MTDSMQENGATPAPAAPSRSTYGVFGRRSVRSREGCMTCKRRKVKCDEQRPMCSHCQRLNMECKWRPQSSNAAAQRRQSAAGGGSDRSLVPPSPVTDNSPNPSVYQPLQAVDEVFDYASFMWDSGDLWQQQAGPNVGQTVSLETQVIPVRQRFDPGLSSQSQVPFVGQPALSVSSGQAATPDVSQVEQRPTPVESDRLMEYFTHSVTPPILAEVETQKKWLAMRQIVVEMSGSSVLVRSSVLAFSNVLLCRREGPWVTNEQNHYEVAVTEVANCDSSNMTEHSYRRENLITALFFLSYSEILETRLEAAHAHLKRAYGIFQQGDKTSFSAVEKQFLLWIRLLDGRAVSAGGEGLFLSKEDETLLVEASPASLDADADDPSKDDTPDGDIEDVLFQVLYHPGIVFYQKVQSFMGRISMIDPWHRNRGTVEDETEVMNIGAGIAADLRTLYEQRPPLMDYAVAGKLTEPHVSGHLAHAITRAFRTSLSNYYASKVHLHRVAYKTLPLTREVADALDHIRRLTRLMVQELDADDALPVNMLWPLLMLGVEEQDREEKVWIKTQILRMERVAGNARITAQVLEEVQKRQDAAKARMDIRSVMLDVFNSIFAII